MVRKAFRASVHPGQQAEYERRHASIWREFEQTLIGHGVRSYSIYLDPHTNDLFAYVEVDSEERWAAIAATDVCRRWWRYMREVMPANVDDSPVTTELREVFHIEDPEAPRRLAGLHPQTKRRRSQAGHHSKPSLLA